MIFGFWGVIIGIILIFIGGFLFFLFPGTAEHQPAEFTVSGIIIGLVLIIVGGLLIFL